MSNKFEEELEQQRERKKLLTKAFTQLRKQKFRIVRLTKSDKNSFLKVWELAKEKLDYSDIEVMCQNNPNMVICRKINETKTGLTKNLILNFNGHRQDVVDAIKKSGLEVINENDINAIVVKLVD